MRKPLSIVALLAALASCGESPSGSQSSSSASSQLSGLLSQWIIPSTATVPAFKDFNLIFYSWDAWANDPNAGGPEPGGSVSVTSAAPTCAKGGCAWHTGGRISLSGASEGMFVQTSAPDAAWTPTTSFIFSPNQVQQASRLGTQMAAFNTAYAVPQAALPSWASQLNMDANTLLARGVCLALIWNNTTSVGLKAAPSVAGATISASGGPDGVLIGFPNDTYTTLGNRQTNLDGAVLIVGPQNPNSDAPVRVPLNIGYASAKKYPNPTAVLRPGTLTVMPILPQQQQ